MIKVKNILKLAAVIISIFCIKIVLSLLPFPELQDFKNRHYSTVIYDCNDQIIQYLPLQNGLRREFTPLNEIPESVQKAFIKSEDKRFYFHFGVDIFSLTRAFFQNVTKQRQVSGASTITMQLARIILPSDERNLRAKIKDVVNAFRLELRLSKKQILELYLNNIPFGKNTEGITSAAKTFFGAQITELSIEQAYCLAVIPRSPALYNPLDNPEKCANAAYKITPKKIQYENLLDAANNSHGFIYPENFPHLVNYLRKNNSAHTDQTKIQLSVNLDLQNFCQSILEQSMEEAAESRITNGALLVTEVKTGKILSWIGNIHWNDNENSGQIDGVINPFQPGSSMKPFLYALALDKNLITPTTVLPDIPKKFGSENLYIPQNFNNRFNGCVSVRVALASSLNIPAVELLEMTGIETYIDKLQQMNFYNISKDADYGLGLALGNAEVSLFELVPAFSTFITDGNFIELTYFDDYPSTNRKNIYSSDTARLICSFLSDKKSRALGFGLYQSFQTDFPSIFKTGTANQYQNIVALGATNNYAVGVWMGNFNGNTVIGKTGSSLPAWTAKQILDFLETGNQHQGFDSPDNYHLQKVCSLSQQTPGPYCSETVYEYVKKDTTLPECSWHLKDKNNLPAEYENWVKLYEKDFLIDFSSENLEIISPVNNSIFYMDSNKNYKKQIIPLEVIGGKESQIKIYLDGEFINQIDRNSSSENFTLPATKGSHEITVICGNEQYQSSYFVK